jgi:hypothetical protein
MKNAELLLLTGSAFVVYAAAVVGSATVLGRTERIPRSLQTAVIPSAAGRGAWWRRVYLGISVTFMLISQGILLIWLVSEPPSVGSLIVIGEFVLALLVAAYIALPVAPEGNS